MSIHPTSLHPAPVRAFALALLSIGMLLATPAPAHAHGDEGVMEVLTAEAAGPLEISIEVGIVYANDDELATEATVTIAATGPDGATVGPIDVPNTTDAKYGTTLGVPTEGVWTLTVTSTEPDAEQTVEVTATTAPVSETAASAPETTANDTPPSTSATDPVGSETTLAPVTTDDADDGSDDGSPLGLLVVIGVLIAGLAAFGMIILRGRSTDPSSEPGDDGVQP